MKHNEGNFKAIIGTHTLAVIRGEAKYETLKREFSPVLKEIKDTITNNQITVEDKSYSIKFILGGDYKVKIIAVINQYPYTPQFLLLLLGLNAAHANYACLYIVRYEVR